MEPPEPEPAVITILQTRDHEVTVYAADTGVSLKTADIETAGLLTCRIERARQDNEVRLRRILRARGIDTDRVTECLFAEETQIDDLLRGECPDPAF